jgi:carboxymethylenebutenolidase
MACPVLLIIGEDDFLFDLVPEYRRRFEQSHIEHQINTYEGAGHAFSAPVPPLRNDAADKASWVDALAFAARHLDGEA